MNWRAKTEKKFEVFSDWLYDNSTKTILIVLLFVGALGTQLPALKIDTSTEGFLHKSDLCELNTIFLGTNSVVTNS